MEIQSPIPVVEAPIDCARCPRLVSHREKVRAEFPDWWNGSVPAFGDPNAEIAIVGLAPGKHGAHRTGRPFTGDASGDLLFEMFNKFGLSEGQFQSRPDDGVTLKNTVILNAVKCLPPQNKPTSEEIRNCQPFMSAAFSTLPNVKVIIALGRIAHQSIIAMTGKRQAAHKFGHGARHKLPNGLMLIDSYHCSRYNLNTKRLTPKMFSSIFSDACELAGKP